MAYNLLPSHNKIKLNNSKSERLFNSLRRRDIHFNALFLFTFVSNLNDSDDDDESGSNNYVNDTLSHIRVASGGVEK